MIFSQQLGSCSHVQSWALNQRSNRALVLRSDYIQRTFPSSSLELPMSMWMRHCCKKLHHFTNHSLDSKKVRNYVGLQLCMSAASCENRGIRSYLVQKPTNRRYREYTIRLKAGYVRFAASGCLGVVRQIALPGFVRRATLVRRCGMAVTRVLFTI